MIEIPTTGVLETNKSFNWLRDGIIYSVGKDRIYLELNDAVEITRALRRLTDRPRPLLVDMHTMIGQAPEVRKYWASDPQHDALIIATALLTTNPVTRMIGNIFLGLAGYKKPLKLFTNAVEAEAWLKGFEP